MNNQNEINQYMAQAVLHNDLEKAKFALDSGANVHYDDSIAITYAATYNYVEMMGLLMENSVLTDESASLALARASIKGSCEMMDLLTSKKGFSQEDLDFALENACLYKIIESVQYLINKGAKVNDDSLVNAVASQSLELVAFLVVQNNDHIEKILEFAKENEDKKIINWCEEYIKRKDLKESLEDTLLTHGNKIKKVKL